MAREVIDIGSAPNDGQGDTLREAGVKINSNFEELYNNLAGGGGGGTSDHGSLTGLSDDDHPQYFNEVRGDARYARLNNTPSFDQIILNNPPTLSNHAVRAGKNIATTEPITGGASLLNNIDIGLSYNSTNLSTPNGSLNTIQDIHTTASPLFGALSLQGGDLKSDDFQLGITDFSGEGYRASIEGDFNMRRLIVREFAKFRELIIDQLSAMGGSFIYSAARGKVESVSGNEVFIEDPNEKGVSQFDADDIFVVRTVDVDGAEIKYITGRVASKNNPGAGNGNPSITLAQDITGTTGSISNISEGDVIVQRGNVSDVTRQDLIYITSTDSDSPVQKFLSGIDSIPAFDNPSNIVAQSGNLTNLNGTYSEIGVDEIGYFSGNFYATDSYRVGNLNGQGDNFIDYSGGVLTVDGIIKVQGEDVASESYANTQRDTALDNISERLGYTDYADFSSDTLPSTLISNNEIRTGLINAHAVLANVGTFTDSLYIGSNQEHILDGVNNEVSLSSGSLVARSGIVEILKQVDVGTSGQVSIDPTADTPPLGTVLDSGTGTQQNIYPSDEQTTDYVSIPATLTDHENMVVEVELYSNVGKSSGVSYSGEWTIQAELSGGGWEDLSSVYVEYDYNDGSIIRTFVDGIKEDYVSFRVKMRHLYVYGSSSSDFSGVVNTSFEVYESTFLINNTGAYVRTSDNTYTKLGTGGSAVIGSAGSVVQSVFGRTGDITAQESDYDSFFVPKSGGTFTGPVGFNDVSNPQYDIDVGGGSFHAGTADIGQHQIPSNGRWIDIYDVDSNGTNVGVRFMQSDSTFGTLNDRFELRKLGDDSLNLAWYDQSSIEDYNIFTIGSGENANLNIYRETVFSEIVASYDTGNTDGDSPTYARFGTDSTDSIRIVGRDLTSGVPQYWEIYPAGGERAMRIGSGGSGGLVLDDQSNRLEWRGEDIWHKGDLSNPIETGDNATLGYLTIESSGSDNAFLDAKAPSGEISGARFFDDGGSNQRYEWRNMFGDNHIDLVRHDGSNSTSLLHIKKTGEVGVRHTDPVGLLHVRSISDNAFKISDTQFSDPIQIHVASSDGYGFLTLPAGNRSGSDTSIRGGNVGSQFGGEVDAVDFNTTSDRRIKDDLQLFNNPLKLFEPIKGMYSYLKSGKRRAGLIAQEVQAGNPLLVGTKEHEDFNELLTISAHTIGSLAVAGVKGLIDKTDKMKNEYMDLHFSSKRKIESLKDRVSNLEKENEELKRRVA